MMKLKLEGLNRTRTKGIAPLTTEELDVIVARRNKQRKEGETLYTFEVMTDDQVFAYRNNVIEAIERNEGKLNGTVRTGGIPTRLIEEHLEELLVILQGVDARIDAVLAAEADEVISEDVQTILLEGLTPKETKVLLAIVEHSECEYGLPCDKASVAKDSGIKGKALSGIISSLTKKGLVEQYDMDGYDGEFFLSEVAFEAFCIIA